MKNSKIKMLSLGLLSTIVMSSTPVLANTNTYNRESEQVALNTMSNFNNQNNSKAISFLTKGVTWNEHVWDVVSNGGVVKKGDRGQAVSEVQGYLRLAGYDIENDSIFGQATKDAVIDYQESHNIYPVDGKVGKKTWNVLKYEISR